MMKIEPINCPLCGTKLILTQISLTTAIFMCNNLDCKYPVDNNECMYIENNNIGNYLKNAREEKQRVAVKKTPKSRALVNSGGISPLNLKTSVRRKVGIVKKIEETAHVEDGTNKSPLNTECRPILDTEVSKKYGIKIKKDEKESVSVEDGTNSQYPVSTECIRILEIKEFTKDANITLPNNIENGTNSQYSSVNAECNSIEEILVEIIGKDNYVEKQIEEKKGTSSVVEENDDLIDFDALLNNYINQEEIEKSKTPQDSSISDDLSRAYLDDFFTDLLN